MNKKVACVCVLAIMLKILTRKILWEEIFLKMIKNEKSH